MSALEHHCLEIEEQASGELQQFCGMGMSGVMWGQWAAERSIGRKGSGSREGWKRTMCHLEEFDLDPEVNMEPL